MITTAQIPELLMPAGDLDKLQFALAYGADAVYAGVPVHSLRARENRFRLPEIAQAIALTHSQGKRIYLTMNIYAHNSKVQGFLNSFCQLADLEPDGFIMSDAGLIAQARCLRPNAVIHLSTQANATNWAAAEFWHDLGVRRIILPRELSLTEIAEIHQRVPEVELEAFVHGAICIAYSGRCLISNYLNHRDANQGTCSNSCRWQYRLALEKGSILAVEQEQVLADSGYQPLLGSYSLTETQRPEQRFAMDEDEHGTYLMNSRDLCAIELLAELRDAGICSFKVEGRTKSEYYLAVITRAYRGALEDLRAGRPLGKAHVLETLSTSSRTFTTGFYLRRPKQYGENFDDADSLPLSHRYCGRVLEYEPLSGKALIEAKNKITGGDMLEWIRPESTTAAKAGPLFNLKGEEIAQISGGCRCMMQPPLPVDRFTLLRNPLRDKSD